MLDILSLFAMIAQWREEAERRRQPTKRKGETVDGLMSATLKRCADELDSLLVRPPWHKCDQRHPPPHARYVVKRDGAVFTATPCYGLHKPWWVVTTMEREVPPVPIRDGDEWLPLDKLAATVERP